MIKKMISAVIASTNCYIANILQIPDKKKSGAAFFQKKCPRGVPGGFPRATSREASPGGSPGQPWEQPWELSRAVRGAPGSNNRPRQPI